MFCVTAADPISVFAASVSRSSYFHKAPRSSEVPPEDNGCIPAHLHRAQAAAAIERGGGR